MNKYIELKKEQVSIIIIFMIKNGGGSSQFQWAAQMQFDFSLEMIKQKAYTEILIGGICLFVTENNFFGRCLFWKEHILSLKDMPALFLSLNISVLINKCTTGHLS